MRKKSLVLNFLMQFKTFFKLGLVAFLAAFLMGATSTMENIKPVKPEITKGVFAQAEKTLSTMTVDEKIGQLFMVAVWSEWQEKTLSRIYSEAEQYHIGGVCFFAGSAFSQVEITNKLNEIAKIPMLVGVDGEWGLGMRVTDAFQFPYAMNVGAVSDSSLVYEMGKQIGEHCRRLGVHINFAPVHDLNSNPLNPVINYRSFGSGVSNVSAKCKAYMLGMQSEGVLAVAKHFPGHGDTQTDSHHALPVIDKSLEEFEEFEMKPFQNSIDNGLQAMMIGHLSVPQLVTHDLPASLNPEIIYGIVKQKMGFKGLIVSDALNMEAVSKGIENHYLKAFQAGNDILLFPEDVVEGIRQIKAGLAHGDIAESELDERCLRVLSYKYALGVQNFTPISKDHLLEDINPVKSKVLNYHLLEQSLTLVRNVKSVIPFKDLDKKKIAAVSINGDEDTFLSTLKKYTAIDVFHSTLNTPEEINDLISKLSGYDEVIVGLHGYQKTKGVNYGISDADITFVVQLSEMLNVHVVLMANPYAIRRVTAEEFIKIQSLMFTYGDNDMIESLAAQALFGGVALQGKLPLQINDFLHEGLGYQTKVCRLSYVDIPEVAGLNSEKLTKIDTIVDELISEEMSPGCQVLVARHGKVVFSKAYGYHTYAKTDPVQEDDLYDIASVTKVAATVPLIMELKDEGVLNLRNGLSTYLPELKNKPNGKLNIKELLLHQAGLQSYIGFDFQLLDEDKLKGSLFHKGRTAEYSIKLTPGIYMTNKYVFKDQYLSDTADAHFNVKVAEGVYTFAGYRDEMFHTIDTLPLRNNKKYQYSDLGFYYAFRVVEAIGQKPINEMADERLYAPLGMNCTLYNPLTRYDKKRIVPTVDELFFRHQLLQGYVHDQGAALMGGVAGHAGLFSNANDLAKLFQMYLNQGFYGRKNYVFPNTIKYFTQHTEHDFRRGVGFDKPETHTDRPQPTCISASPSTFGHTGFTGIGIWADPENDLIYIFLSNRVHPDSYNNKFSKENIRPRIQQVIYDALL